MAINTSPNENNGFIRLKAVLQLFPVSKATWWNGCREGKYPKPYKLSSKVTAWRVADINELLLSYQQNK